MPTNVTEKCDWIDARQTSAWSTHDGDLHAQVNMDYMEKFNLKSAQIQENHQEGGLDNPMFAKEEQW